LGRAETTSVAAGFSFGRFVPARMVELLRVGVEADGLDRGLGDLSVLLVAASPNAEAAK
jgi:hypothetical protein